MKAILFTLLLLVFGALLQLYFPWWGMPLAAGLLALFFDFLPPRAFIWGFLGAALLWGGYAGYLNLMNEGILAGRIGGLFGGLPAVLMVMLTALLGGLFGGLGAMTGSLAKGAFSSPNKLAA